MIDLHNEDDKTDGLKQDCGNSSELGMTYAKPSSELWAFFVNRVSSCTDFGLSGIILMINYYIDGLVQDCSISIANALELLKSCTKPST